MKLNPKKRTREHFPLKFYTAPHEKKSSSLSPLKTFALYGGSVAAAGIALVLIGTYVVIGRVVEGPGESLWGSAANKPFPIGVDPSAQLITENPDVDEFFVEAITEEPLATRSKESWFSRVLATLTHIPLYQNIASPTGRILVIQSGERKEEVAYNFGEILDWTEEERALFIEEIISAEPSLSEGKFTPSTYITGKSASPKEVAVIVNEHFKKEVLARYGEDIAEKVSLADALTIASILEREAYDFEDMRYISGIIWNRLFAGMKLQIDATLQYAKGTEHQTKWWPNVVPDDKYIDSMFNTYENKGLPPAPIANPSLDAILAALNPRKTDCMFYFHDRDGGFHCSITYEEHVTSLKEYYGQGK
jgi:UPF0755 protein